MKAYYCFIAVFLPIFGFSQLYVGTTGMIYSKDYVVCVTKEINNAGAFYLRGDAQLIQKTTGVSANKGSGALSVYQEGSSNQYKYNYWCSPVGGLGVGTTGNDNFGITQLFRPTGVISSQAATILPIGDYDGVSNPLSISQYWIWKFLSGSQYSEWIGVFDTSTIKAGEGFTMKGVSGSDALVVLGVANNSGSKQRYDFKGRPNDGTITVNVGSNKFTLTGNPYPSALDLNAFLLDAGNTAVDGTALFWEQSATPNSHILGNYVGGYGVYLPINMSSTGSYVPATFMTFNGDGSINNPNVGSGSMYERRYSPIGQGFLVKGTANGSVSIKNAHRVFKAEGQANFSQFERNSGIPGPPGSGTNLENGLITPTQIRINVDLGNEYTRQLLLMLIPESTNGVDRGMDGQNPGLYLPQDVSFYLDDKDYIAQSVPFDINQHIPLSIKSDAPANLNFSLSETINFDQSEFIYIYDSLDGSYHDIKNSSYPVSIPAGNDTSRFQIRFTTEENLETPDMLSKNIDVFQNNNEKELLISNPQMLKLDSLQLYDISGRMVFEKQLSESLPSFSIPTSNYSTGVYLLKLQSSENGQFVKKIAIRN